MATGNKISTVTLKAFSVFEDVALNFCPGVNVLIGTNATGKSHLMKAVYSMLKASEKSPWDTDNEALKYRVQLLAKLTKVFRPQDESVGRLVKRTLGRKSGSVFVSFTRGGKLSFNATTLGKLTALRHGRVVTDAEPSLFIPSREVLSFHSSLIAAYESTNIRFDETYFDLAKALAAPTMLGKRANAAAQLVSGLEKVLGGKVFEAKDGSLHLRNKHGDFEPHLLSEGWRKLASLCRLILNGSLMENGFLFWDEPEANLNPEMIVMVAKMLRLLAASGVQIFISTHDYLLTRHLSLAAEYPAQMAEAERCDIRFFGLTSANGTVSVIEAATLSDLGDNPILKEFAALYDYEGSLFEKSIPK